MDIREEIVREVSDMLSGKEITVDLVQDVITIVLDKYEVQERHTDVAVRDNNNEDLLKKFVATKRVEGLSESTIRRYKEQNITLMNFLGKPLNRITSYDIRFYLSVKRERDRVSNRTLDGMRRCYNSFFKWVTDEGVHS